MISLPLSRPTWVDRQSLELVVGPDLPADLTANWDTAIAALDHGLLRLRLIGNTLVVETTEDPQATLVRLYPLFLVYPTACARVRVVNLKTQQDTASSLRNLLEPPKSTLATCLQVKPLLAYRFPDICDAATTREQHRAVYGSRLALDWERLNLDTTTKTLTFAHPAGFPHIRFATRHPVLGLREVYLVADLQMHEAQDKAEWKHPVAWVHRREGVVWAGGAPQKFDFLDSDLVAEHFGEFDLAAVNGTLTLAAQAHGWNRLPIPRAWESAPLPAFAHRL